MARIPTTTAPAITARIKLCREESSSDSAKIRTILFKYLHNYTRKTHTVDDDMMIIATTILFLMKQHVSFNYYRILQNETDQFAYTRTTGRSQLV